MIEEQPIFVKPRTYDFERDPDFEEKEEEPDFLEAWCQKSAKLEMLKGDVRDRTHIGFNSDNDLIFWTRRGIGLISIQSLANDTCPYKMFISSRSLYHKNEEVGDDIKNQDTNIWRQMHKLGPRMIKEGVHVNEQFMVYRALHKLRFHFNPDEIQEMIARDSCRKGDIHLTKCKVSAHKRDPFVLIMNNIGQVDLIANTQELNILNLSHMKKSGNSGYFSFVEKHKILFPDFNRVYFTQMEAVVLSKSASLIFLCDNKNSLHLFKKECGEGKGVQYSGSAHDFAKIKLIQACKQPSYTHQDQNSPRVCIVDSRYRVGILSLRTEDEGPLLKREAWIDTNLDHISTCLFVGSKIYISEYGDVYQISLPYNKQTLNSEAHNIRPKLRESFDNKVISFTQSIDSETLIFLENGHFYKLLPTRTQGTAQNTQIDAGNQMRIENPQEPRHTSLEPSPLEEFKAELSQVNSAVSSLNKCLVVISGTNHVFSSSFVTKYMIHPKFRLLSRDSQSIIEFLQVYLTQLRQKTGNYMDLIYCLKKQNSLAFFKTYLESALYKKKNSKANQLRQELIMNLGKALGMLQSETKLLLFAFYINILHYEKLKLRLLPPGKGLESSSEIGLTHPKYIALKVKMIQKYWKSRLLMLESEGRQEEGKLINNWLQGKVHEFTCPYCGERGNVALDYSSLVVGCGHCGQMSCVDHLTGRIVKGESVRWFCVACALMLPAGGKEEVHHNHSGKRQGNQGAEEKDSMCCFLCNNRLVDLTCLTNT